MRQPTRWAHTVLGGALFTVCGVACDTVLDIQDPKMRPDAAGGEAGDVAEPTGAGTHGNVTMPSGGEGGAEPAPVKAGAGGEAGTPAMKECDPDAVRCGTDAAAKTPQICDKTGHWVANTDEANGDCAVLCDAGKCVECNPDAVRCAVCKDDDASCSTNQPQTCVDGAWVDEGDKPCAQFCDAGVCKTAPSCNAASTDRTTCQGSKSCCASVLVPGGKFKLVEPGSHQSSAAEVSPFLLDKFEVTVGRMRQFVFAFDQINLKSGAGKSAHIKDDPGWDTDYSLPVDTNALVTQLKCSGTTWSDNQTMSNDLPVNCAPFNIAYAFCIWDGGRLPTEAEWYFAAAGGEESRAYPWKAPASGPAITDDYANYGNAYPGPIAVGSKPMGDGRWGQSDLSGNVVEWTLDYYGDYPAVCENCLGTSVGDRTFRGGSYDALVGDFLLASVRNYGNPNTIRPGIGFRCARDLSTLLH
jgi:formylglycine-generating enzyme